MKLSAKTVAYVFLYVFICLIVVSSAFVGGYVARAAQSPVDSQVTAFSVFWEAWTLVDDHFYGPKVDETERTYGAIRGSLAALRDPYTVFIEPQRHDREQEELRGSFGGIGAFIERAPDGRVILTPMEGRPAAEAGIVAGDELIAVDDTPITPDMSFEDVLAVVRGRVGDVVRLTVRREGVADPLEFEVKRAEIVTPSVTWELKEADIGYIRLALFNERTSDELEEAIGDLRDQGATKFIIDLRDNGGGLLTAAIDVASQFLEDGVVMYERKNTGEEKPYPVKSRGVALDDPLILLVNGNTASASEIVAGALQDYGRAELIGTQTFGKASVQLILDLSDGSSLHVTNAHWLTPSRHEIHGVGLAPEIEVVLTDEDRQSNLDPQLDRAIAYLRQNDGENRPVVSEKSDP